MSSTTDPDGLRLGDEPSASTKTTGITDVGDFLVDTIQRLFEKYRPKGLERLKDVVFGEPERLVDFPSVAIVPDSGERERADCDRAANGTEVMAVKIYVERAAGTQSKNAARVIAQYIDALRDLLYENLELRNAEDPRRRNELGGRVYEAWPGRHVIGSFLDYDAGGNEHRIRGGVLEVTVTIYTDVIAQTPGIGE